MVTDFSRVFIFILIGIGFTGMLLVLGWLIRPRRPYPDKNSTYECGEDPVGISWVKFNIRFYVIALIFVIFEVEVVFLFTRALVFKELGLFGFLEMVVFLAILIVGYAYVWVKGDLDWDKPSPKISRYVKGVGVVTAKETEIHEHAEA